MPIIFNGQDKGSCKLVNEPRKERYEKKRSKKEETEGREKVRKKDIQQKDILKDNQRTDSPESRLGDNGLEDFTLFC